jgi:transcription elongation factor Elf1
MLVAEAKELAASSLVPTRRSDYLTVSAPWGSRGGRMTSSTMTDPWQTTMSCRKCAARVVVSLETGDTGEPGLAVFYCPACGERCQVEHPAGYNPLSVATALVGA